MVKYLLILINSFFLLLYGFFNGDNGIVVTSKIPTAIVAGQETPIELTITKGAMNGFAKLQLELPSDFTIKESEDKGASYSYNEGIAKWVWAALPTESEIVIKLVVIAPASSIGPKTISAKYSYVENNVKQVVEMVPAEVNVVGSASDVAAVPKDTNSLPAQVTSNIESPGAISITRKTEMLTASEYFINIMIVKGGTKGFARYSDDLPADVVVKSATTDGASFSVADGKIKFVWVNVPEKDTLRIAYTMNSSSTQNVNLVGEYSYLEDNQSKKFNPENLAIAFESTAPPETKKEPEPVVEPQAPVVPVAVVPVVKEKPKKAETPKKEKRSKTTPSMSANQQGMVYHVQIGAFSKKKMTSEKLAARFKVDEQIDSEMRGGFSKFMVGNHQEYREARDHRETMISDKGIKSSFVVAYNNGQRITVQEALTISNQKWFK